VRLLADFFRNKGLEALKQEDRQEDWYEDWIEFQAKHGLYAGLDWKRATEEVGARRPC
jgi:hypothetical protein